MPPQPRTNWLSQGFENLAAQISIKTDRHAPDFEVVVVGSGYGGSVAASLLAARLGQQVCVLERGREYLQGMFPANVAEVPGHVRFSSDSRGPRGKRTGLFDFRLSGDVTAVVANGLGGGSLINAGVMEQPQHEVIQQPSWPRRLRNLSAQDWDQLCDEARNLLGAQRSHTDDYGRTRLPIMQRLGGQRFRKPALTVAMADQQTYEGVEMRACVQCGDCATGCNYGAKVSLDTNLLVRARRLGARIYSGATVERVERSQGRWVLHVNHTDAQLKRRQGAALRLVANKVILAAGTLGSTEILLRSRTQELQFSQHLGHRFSANGDSFAACIDLPWRANAVSKESGPAPSQLEVGPTITGLIEASTGPRLDDRFVVQDLAVPSSLRRIFQEIAALATGFDDLARGDDSKHSAQMSDPSAIDDDSTDHALTVALIGHDRANGLITLNDDPDATDGAVRVHWPEARNDPRLGRQHEWLVARLAGESAAHVAANPALRKPRVLANPLWRLVPPQMEFLLQDARGPLLTVHPLGGCVMGDDTAHGVVDDLGRVFDGQDAASLHPGLAVLDGSIVPSSLGINPALTITALSLRAARRLCELWYPAVPPGNIPPPRRRVRPRFRRLDPDLPRQPPPPTRVELVERLYGEIRVPGIRKPLNLQLTLQSKPTVLASLSSPTPAERTVAIDPARSTLRVFDGDTWRDGRARSDDELHDTAALWVAPLAPESSLRIFQPQESSHLRRRLRALWAWLRNRGLRDTFQYAFDGLVQRGAPPETSTASPWERFKGSWKLASLAGEVRTFEYDIRIGQPTRGGADHHFARLTGAHLRGTKTLTYSRRSNPWRQLARVRWSIAGFQPGPSVPLLKLDLRYLERRGIPLLRLVEQSDQVHALLDAGALVLYALRVLLRIHTWSFRKPDARSLNAPKPNLDPRAPRGMTGGRSEYVALAKTSADEPDAHIRLTRFANEPNSPPVLMIHGYSTSGSTFAHPHAPSLAKHMWKRGWEPWVLDMRTSAALQTARHPWSFEQVGYADIPLAVDTVMRRTGAPKVYVVAHCIGAAMTCMALLGDLPGEPGSSLPPTPYTPPDPYPHLRGKLRERIGGLVLSQVTPYSLYTPDNVFRAFILRYLRHYLLADDYAFRVEYPMGVRDQLFDRLLTTIPYPEQEFDRENPLRFWRRTPWTATRHRMDALYGRDFSVQNVSDEVLKHIDDLFGPLSIETVSQAIHFARRRVLTDRMGMSRFVTPERLAKRLPLHMLSLHAQDNGLVDISTASYMEQIYAAVNQHDGGKRRVLRLRDFGHQDSLIGKRAERDVFPEIEAFLTKCRELQP